ncbi:MAG TPA: FAD:protein FMN transferase [Candidatus Limnocylindrales bacterium]|jgi:thiamine biosynthesis lipoprotein|nr:FAD:protein FMN transferase [Candidatus Limnocylindrales bacterium]
MALRRVEPVMGTMVSIDVRDRVVPTDAVDGAVAWLHEVDARFSPFRPDSEISRLAEGTLAEVDAHPDVHIVLALCDELRRDSDGAFDARAWRSDGRLDPSGLVKGWAVQLAADRLVVAGVRAFAINAGGDIVARSSPTIRGSWRVGIRHPDHIDRVASVVAVQDGAVATSGDYERGAHIRDPRSGGARATGLRSVTVAGPSLTWADAYATTAFIKGVEGLAWVARHEGYAAYAITDDDRVLWTEGFERYLAAA